MKIRRILTVACGMALFGGLLTACGNKGEQAENDSVAVEESDAAAVATVEEGDSVTNAPTDTLASTYNAAYFQAKDGKYQTTPTGLKYAVVKEGNGAAPGAEDEVTVHYTGRLLDGTVFDSSVERGEPATFPLNRVIPGWTEGLQLMKEGGTTVFYIPSNLAYGEAGTPGGPIGPNQDLIFTVELIKVNK